MRTAICLTGIGLVFAAVCLSLAQEKGGGKPGSVAVANPAGKAAAKPVKKEAQPAAGQPQGTTTKKTGPEPRLAKPAAAEKRSPDEDEIRHTAETFTKAYNQGDATAAAAHFTTDAEYIDEQGNVFEGRGAIEKNLRRFFAENLGAMLEIHIESIRVLNPGVAVEDGTTVVTSKDGAPLAHSRYLAVHAGSNGKWQVATVREHAPKGERRHREELEQLAWLVGDWIDESDESIVNFTCRPVDDGNFLLREFTVTVAGEEVLYGSQRIGWDPLTGRLRGWTFDSQGGHFEGVWHRDGDSWLLNSTGVTADGQTASGTSIFTYVNPHTITWQAVDHEIEGMRTPDSELYTLVRKGPLPETADTASKK